MVTNNYIAVLNLEFGYKSYQIFTKIVYGFQCMSWAKRWTTFELFPIGCGLSQLLIVIWH